MEHPTGPDNHESSIIRLKARGSVAIFFPSEAPR